MSIYLRQDTNLEGQDPRVLEMKIHYLMGMLAKAGLLLDANGKPVTAVTTDVQQDTDTVQASILQDNFS
jgi:hypothetical protein